MKTRALSIFFAVLLVPAALAAQNQGGEGEDDEVTTYHFPDVQVEGETVVPPGSFVSSVDRDDSGSLTLTRDDFVQELLMTVEDL